MSDKTVFITGAAGFIGRYVARIFSANGYEVNGIGWGKFSDYQEWGLNSWNECEVTLETLNAFARTPDVMVHCAGGSSVQYSVEHPCQDFNLTVDTTSFVLEYIRLHSPRSCFVYPSSAAVYGEIESIPIPEETSLKPISPYGIHKLMAEQLCRMYAGHYGVSIAVVRLFSIYGEGLRKQLLWDACKKASNRDFVFFGTGEEIRDWLHVTDAATLILNAARHASDKCPVANGGTGNGVKVKLILEYLVGKICIGENPVFSSKYKEGDPSAYEASIEQASLWGWQPEIKWKEGVDNYIQWFKAEYLP